MKEEMIMMKMVKKKRIIKVQNLKIIPPLLLMMTMMIQIKEMAIMMITMK